MIHLDFESRSRCDIWQSGAWVYSQDPSTEILCLAYAIDEEPVKILTRGDLDLIDGERWSYDSDYDELIRPLLDAIAKGVPIVAHNALFEQCIYQNILVKHYGWPRVPIKQWRCTMAKALARSLPRSLKDCGKALNADRLKSDEGHRVMMKVCKPNPKTGAWNEDPEDFQKLYDYCMDDVEAERAIDKLMPDLIPSEQTVWFLDQLINQRGIHVDIDAINRSLEFIEAHTENSKKFVEDVSNGKLDGVTRRMAVLQWCKDQGVDISGYTKADVQATLAKTDLPEAVRAVLQTRVELGKTSVAKYKAFRDSVSVDGRIRDTIIYHGASTGRWAGKLIQIQNLPKGKVKDTDTAIKILKDATLEDFQIFYPDVMETLSSCIRGMITAAPGNDLIVADYSAIEARIVMWLAGEEYGLKQFREGVDLYVDMARVIYSNNDISKDSPERQLGKAAVLGCGYGMGPNKFLATCTSWGIPVSEAIAQKAVETYRRVYLRVKNSWYDQERAAIECVKTKQDTPCGRVIWKMDGGALLCQLPSGRSIVYNSAVLEYVETAWKEKKLALHHMAVNSTTKKWELQPTYGGKLVENITQAVARDILAEAMVRAEVKRYHVIFSVHDEIVCEVPKDFGSVEEYESILCTLPAWADGCPIEAKGWRGDRYRKG